MLKCHADVFADVFLNAFQRALCVHEIRRHLVFEKGVTGGFESFNLRGAEFHACVLLVVEFLAFFVDGLVLKLCRIVGEEAFYVGLKLLEFCVFRDGGAEFFGFGKDGCFLEEHAHGKVVMADSPARNRVFHEGYS